MVTTLNAVRTYGLVESDGLRNVLLAKFREQLHSNLCTRIQTRVT